MTDCINQDTCKSCIDSIEQNILSKIAGAIMYKVLYTIPSGLSDSELRLWQNAVISAKQDIIQAIEKELG
jgi:hypothetical protein